MIYRVGVLIQHAHMIIVEIFLSKQYLLEREPGLIPIGEIKPSARLTMNVKNQVEKQLKYLE
jgi:hypothetical protein